MAENIKGMKRTSRVALLTKDDIGKEVTLMGWVHNYRNLGSLLFIDLRDVSGICQVFFGEDCEESLKEKASTKKHPDCGCNRDV